MIREEVGARFHSLPSGATPSAPVLMSLIPFRFWLLQGQNETEAYRRETTGRDLLRAVKITTLAKNVRGCLGDGIFSQNRVPRLLLTTQTSA
jgi:hypothetical protein